jgi:hypothetical protein
VSAVCPNDFTGHHRQFCFGVKPRVQRTGIEADSVETVLGHGDAV